MMIDSGSFKKLKFTQRRSQEENPWLQKLDAIEKYSNSSNRQPPNVALDIPSSTRQVEHLFDNRLRFKLEFDSTLNENQELPETACVLHLYERISDSRLHPIYTQEALDVLYLELDRENRGLSDSDRAWLTLFMPYFFTHSNGELRILLPASLEIEFLKALCLQELLFYFDPEPKLYDWLESSSPLHFMLQLTDTHDEWKLWGKFVTPECNAIDLWDVQAATPGGVARQNHQLFEYANPAAYSWIETLLSGGPIRCSNVSLQEFIYRLLCLVDHKDIAWPDHMKIEPLLASLQPIFYVKTKDDKKNYKTKIEGFTWYRTEGFEYPSDVHRESLVPSRAKVFRLNVHKLKDGQYHVSFHVPNLEAEHRHLEEIQPCTGISWNALRRSFGISLPHATEIFYYLLNRGWEVWAENLQIKLLKELEIQLTTYPNWFEIDVMAGKPASKISAWQLIHLLKKQRMFIQLSDVSLGVLPERWYREFQRLFALRSPDSTDEENLKFSTAYAFHFAQMADMAENSSEMHFKGDPAFEQIRREILNINGLKPMQPAPSFKLTLRPYQEMGLSWLHFLGRTRLGGCLADDMGLGKTIQVLAYLDLKRFELQKKGKFRTLLICPRSLLEHWFQEAKKYAPRLEIFILRASQISKLELLFEHYDLLLISYGLARQHIQVIQKYTFDLLALDEAQLIKNASTQIAMAVNQLSSVQRLAISGTPIENHLNELFSLFEFLNPGFTSIALLKTLGSQLQEEPAPNSMLTQFLKGIRPLILRRLKTEVAKELPEKLEQLLVLPMLEQQESIYNSLRNYYQEQLKKQSSELFYDKSFFLEGLLRLRQAACHPLLFENAIQEKLGSKFHVDQNGVSEIASNKFEFLIDKLKILVALNHKVIVFSQFTSLLKLFRTMLDELDIFYEYLDGQSHDRMEIVMRFQESQQVSILLAGIKTGGLGLNLTAADYCFILDPWWNPAIEQQAVDRLHRIGQKKIVNIYRMISQHTVEEKMLLLKEKKQKMADQLISADHSFLEQLSYDDFQFLFE